MANINVRAQDDTIELLKHLSEQTRDSQGQVIDKALRLYFDFLKIQEQKRKEILENM